MRSSKKHISYYRWEEERTLAYNRNAGVEKAHGEYIVWLDDDDAFMPNYLEEMIPTLDALPPEYGALGCGRDVIYPEGIVYQPPPKGEFYCSIDDGFLIRKSVFQKVRCDESLSTDEDADFGLHFLKQYELGRLDKMLLLKYGHAIINKTSYSRPTEWRLNGLTTFLKKDLAEFKKNKREYEYICRMAGRTYCMGGWHKFGIPLLWNTLKTRKTIRNILNFFAAITYTFPLYYFIETKISRLIRINL